MSSIRNAERRILEELLGMDSGYVLNFSNSTFADFFADFGDIDIHSSRYASRGTSKAKRLREFWRLEPNHLVGRVILGLVKYWAITEQEASSGQEDLAKRCREIGMRLSGTHQDTDPQTERRIWGDGGFRVFLSHKASVKRQTAKLKEELAIFGISAFVAHEDIKPTREWVLDIESALNSMDAFVALMTRSFHESDWTDQEVGYALCRGVPVASVRLGLDPYGFIGRFQAIPGGWEGLAVKIASAFINNGKAFAAYIDALRVCSSFDNGNTLAEVLQDIEEITSENIDGLVDAYNTNGEVRGAFGFNGTRPGVYGPGLLKFIHSRSTRRFRQTAHRLAERD
jgi:hypothetical protein